MSTLVRLTRFGGWVRHMFRPCITPDLRAGRGGLIAYLNRYTLRKQNDSGANPWRVYLHEFLAADSAGHHNHPSTWGFSIVLWGSYTEEVLEPGECQWHGHGYGPRGSKGPPDFDYCIGGVCDPVRTRRVRFWNWIPATKYHRITTLHPGRVPWAPWRRCRAVWSIFICGPLSGRGWGFFVAGRGHVDHSAMEHTRVVEIDPKAHQSGRN